MVNCIEIVWKVKTLIVVIIINEVNRVKSQPINTIPYGFQQYQTPPRDLCEERYWIDFTKGYIPIEGYYNGLRFCQNGLRWTPNANTQRLQPIRQQIPLIRPLQQQQQFYWQPLQQNLFSQRQPLQQNLLFPYQTLQKPSRGIPIRLKPKKPIITVPQSRSKLVTYKQQKQTVLSRTLPNKKKLFKLKQAKPTSSSLTSISPHRRPITIKQQPKSKSQKQSPNAFKLKTSTKQGERKKSKPSAKPKVIKDNTELTNVLSSLILANPADQVVNPPYYNGQNYLQPSFLYNNRPITPYYYLQYPWWAAYPMTVDLHKNTRTEQTGIYPTNDFDARVRKAFINANSNPKANIENDLIEIRSFLRKQKSDTSMFQEESTKKESDVDNEHALTLTDYESFISHPKNTTFESFDDIEEEETGSVRSLDNIIDGDDDDDIIAEATEIRANQVAKAGVPKEDNSLIRNHVLRKQETLRKLEHDKLIERYARPPANPIEYLSEIFDELDTDTKMAEDSRKGDSEVKVKNSADSLPKDREQQEDSQKKQDVNSNNKGVSKESLKHDSVSLVLGDKGNNTNDDENLLTSVFNQLNPVESNTTNELYPVKTKTKNKTKRSPIVNIDLEGWFHVPKYKPRLNARSRVVGKVNKDVYPIGDIADLALTVNKKRDNIRQNRNRVQIPHRPSNNLMGYIKIGSRYKRWVSAPKFYATASMNKQHKDIRKTKKSFIN